MKLALLGGSFNPIHNSHVMIAKNVLASLKYDKVLFMPAYISPFKVGSSSFVECAPQDRLKMVELAIEDEICMEASSYEISKNEISFTIKTLEHLYKHYNSGQINSEEKSKIEGKIALIIGSDNLISIKKWHCFEKIIEKSSLIVAKRGEEIKKIEGVDFTLLSGKVSLISSSSIREKIKNGGDWRSDVPLKVVTYIEDNALYGYPFKDIENLICEITKYAKAELSEKRFFHSVRVAEMAELLSDSYPALCINPRLAYLSGIAHDITKEKKDEWQILTIKEKNQIIDNVESSSPVLLHGRTASIVLKEKFGIKHRSLLDAISYHTLSHPALDYLGKILYIADKIEVGRKGVDDLRGMIGTSSIDEIMLTLLEKNEVKLKEKGAKPHPNAIELLKRLKNITPTI